MNIKIVLSLSPVILFAACSTPAPDANKTSALPEVPHPDAIAAIQWKIGDTCVNEYRFGFKKSVHTGSSDRRFQRARHLLGYG